MSECKVIPYTVSRACLYMHDGSAMGERPDQIKEAMPQITYIYKNKPGF